MSIKAVIFDLDGTITQPYFDFDAIREEMGLERNSGPVLEAMEKMTVQQRQRAEEILHFHERRAVTESTLNAGAKQTLSELRKAGIGIGILTRNRRSNVLAVAEKHNLSPREWGGQSGSAEEFICRNNKYLAPRFGKRPAARPETSRKGPAPKAARSREAARSRRRRWR